MAGYGIVEIEGVQYVERPQYFSEDVTLTVANQILLNQRVNLPGIAGFMLKGLAQEIIAANVAVARPHRFRFGNTDGGIWYASAGIGGANDRVVNTCIFGNGQFPFPIVPHVFFGKNANIQYEIEDISANVPYTVHITFIGSYLIPV